MRDSHCFTVIFYLKALKLIIGQYYTDRIKIKPSNSFIPSDLVQEYCSLFTLSSFHSTLCKWNRNTPQSFLTILIREFLILLLLYFLSPYVFLLWICSSLCLLAPWEKPMSLFRIPHSYSSHPASISWFKKSKLGVALVVMNGLWHYIKGLSVKAKFRLYMVGLTVNFWMIWKTVNWAILMN